MRHRERLEIGKRRRKALTITVQMYSLWSWNKIPHLSDAVNGCLHREKYFFKYLMIDTVLSFPQLTYLPPPWGDCKSTPMDSDFFNSYSITACRIDCETRYLVENCNCRMVHMPGIPVLQTSFSCQFHQSDWP